MLKHGLWTEYDPSTDLQSITNQAQQAEFGDLWAERCQPSADPDEEIVCQDFQLPDHLLTGKALFVAMGSAQALFILLNLSFHAAA